MDIHKLYKPQGACPPMFQGYLREVPDDGNLLIHLEDIMDDTVELMNETDPEKLIHAYAPGKWTIKDILVHIADTERVFVYRALRFSRGDETPLPGFEENAFAEQAGAAKREIGDIVRELRLIRESTIAFIESLTDEALRRQGVAGGNPVSVLLLLNLVYGHHKHHLNIIYDRYLKG